MTPEELYQKGLEVDSKRDYEVACSYFRQAAEQGYAPAQHELAMCYYHGYGIERDMSLHFSWEMKAAVQGYTEAEYGVGCCYQDGDGVEMDDYEAAKWFRKAAEKGHVEAQNELAEILEYECCGSSQEIFSWYKKAADQGNLDSAYRVGRMYKYGSGTEQNYKKAMEYFRKVAFSKADAFDYPIEDSMREIGWLYYYGQGVEKDERKALIWFKKSVEQIRHYPKRQEWYEEVESFVKDANVWDCLKKYIGKDGKIIDAELELRDNEDDRGGIT